MRQRAPHPPRPALFPVRGLRKPCAHGSAPVAYPAQPREAWRCCASGARLGHAPPESQKRTRGQDDALLTRLGYKAKNPARVI